MFQLKKIAAWSLPLIACVMAQPLAQADRIENGRTVGQTGQTVNARLVVDRQRSDNVYVAAEIGGQLWFMNAQGAFQPYQAGQPTPSALQAPQPGSYTLFDLSVPPSLSGKIQLYTLRGEAGTDIVAAAQSGKADLSTLQQSSYSFNEPARSSHDYNGDGHPDADTNGDGIEDEQGGTAAGASPSAASATTATAAAGTSQGATLYAANCASCHGAAGSALAGIGAATVRAAIAANRGGMGRLAQLTDADLSAITAYLGGASAASTSAAASTATAKQCASGRSEEGRCETETDD
ncbi:MAG: c-type cytochrome [Burkholderiales bacterium]